MFVIPAIAIMIIIIFIIADFVVNSEDEKGETKMKNFDAYCVNKDGTITKKLIYVDTDVDGDKRIKMPINNDMYIKLLNKEITIIGSSTKQNKFINNELIKNTLLEINVEPNKNLYKQNMLFIIKQLDKRWNDSIDQIKR